jgi:glycosyltransferase involved in cell wall biosynthesis
MTKIKIMHIAQAPGGVARYLQMLLKYSNHHLFETVLVCSYDYNCEDFQNIVEHFEQVKMDREISCKEDLKAIYRVRILIKKYKPDIIYCHSSKAGAIGRIASIGLKTKILYNPHGWSFNMLDVKQKKRNLYALIERILSIKTDKIVAISNYEKSHALQYKIVNDNKIYIIPSGIDIEEHDKQIKNNTITRARLGINEDAFVVGMVGRITIGKSPDIFVKAAKIISEQIQNSFFIIVGDGEEREYIESLIAKYKLQNHFLITGWIDNVYDYINLFDQAMLLTKWEGFGLAVAEYMISQKPIITTKVGGIPDIVTDGYNGILLEDLNEHTAAKASIALYNNKTITNTIALNGYNYAKENLDVKRTAKEHEDLFIKLKRSS